MATKQISMGKARVKKLPTTTDSSAPSPKTDFDWLNKGYTLVNVPESAQSLIKFLRATKGLEEFSTPRGVSLAVDKYLKFLSLQRKYPSTVLYPSADIEIVWQAHLVRPISYITDTTLLFGHVLDHSIKFLEQDKTAMKATADLWKKEYGFDYNTTSPLADTSFGDLRNKLIGAVQKDRAWLPSFESFLADQYIESDLKMSFLTSQYKIYLKFHLLARECYKAARPHHLCPLLSVDLLWHAHMLSPVKYRDECLKDHDHIIDHDPWPEHHGKAAGWNVDFDGTDKLWTDRFGGSMYDLLPPRPIFPREFTASSSLKKNVFGVVFSYLSAVETARMGLVSKEWREISRDKRLWLKYLEKDYPKPSSGLDEPLMSSAWGGPRSTSVKELLVEYFSHPQATIRSWLSLSRPEMINSPGYDHLSSSSPKPGTTKISHDPATNPMAEYILRHQFVKVRGWYHLNKRERIMYRKCGIPPEEQVTGEDDCCHGPVKALVEEFFDYSLVKEAVIEDRCALKKKIADDVSHACMLKAMTDNQLKILITEKLAPYTSKLLA